MLTCALSRLARRALRPLNHLHLALDLHLSHPLPRGVEGAGALAGRAAVQGEWLVVLGLRFGIVLTVLVQALGGVYGSWFGTILIILVLIAQFYIVSRRGYDMRRELTRLFLPLSLFLFIPASPPR